jgi:hypothetical protein
VPAGGVGWKHWTIFCIRSGGGEQKKQGFWRGLRPKPAEMDQNHDLNSGAGAKKVF